MRWFVNSVVYFHSLSGVLVLDVCLVVSLCGWCRLCYIFKFLVCELVCCDTVVCVVDCACWLGALDAIIAWVLLSAVL